MSTTRWASGSVAGVNLQDAGGRDCRIDVVDGEAFKGTLVGGSVTALDLTVHTQLIVHGMKGVRFGIVIAQIPIGTVESIITAIEAAVGGGSPFAVILEDSAGVDGISVLCVPDYAAMNGSLFKRSGMAAGYVKGVTMRFISTGPTP